MDKLIATILIILGGLLAEQAHLAPVFNVARPEDVGGWVGIPGWILIAAGVCYLFMKEEKGDK